MIEAMHPGSHDEVIRQAEPADLRAVEQLLRDAALPLEGVREHFSTYLVVGVREQLAGAVGLELYGDTALLRSLVVRPGERRKGLGEKLVAAVLELARRHGARAVVLLTTTAAPFFARRGFQQVDRAAVTGPVTASVEFTSACPASAAVMVLRLPSQAQEP